jgi:hypothetical protein
MRTAKTNKSIPATQGKAMTQSEFGAFIREGEKGTFMTAREFKKRFELWKRGLEK